MANTRTCEAGAAVVTRVNDNIQWRNTQHLLGLKFCKMHNTKVAVVRK